MAIELKRSFRALLGAPPPPKEVERKRVYEPLGGSGTINYKGLLVPDEYNPDLRWPESIRVWERMRRSDPAVRETLWHFTAPILAAERAIEPPPEPSELEAEVTAFVESALFEWAEQSFEDFLQQALTYLPMGHSVFEPVFMVVERSLRVREQVADDDDEVTAAVTPGRDLAEGIATNDKPVAPEQPEQPPLKELPERQFVTLRKFGMRLPTTITEWHVDRSGELKAIKQNAPIVGADGTQTWQEVTIPADQLLVFVNEKWGDEWMGSSVLRAAYKPWTIKEMIERVMGVSYERHGAGIPVAYVPKDRENDVELIDKLEIQLRNLRAGEFSYLLFPGPKSTGNMPGYNFDIASPPGGFPDFSVPLEYLRGEIKGALLVRFSELGHGSSGARATATTQAEVWYAALLGVANYVAAMINDFIQRLVDLNYTGVERYPRLVFRSIKARNLLEFAQAVALLANAQMLHGDTPTREWVRREVEAPDEDAGEAELRRQMSKLEADVLTFGLETDPSETARPRTSKTNTPDEK